MQRLIICDDSPRDRAFLAEGLKQFSPIETGNAADALQACCDCDEPWLITDIQMPDMNGIELAKQLWCENKLSRIVFWSQHSDETYVRALAKLIPAETVYGYILKNSPLDTLTRAVESVFKDCQCWIDPLVRKVQARSQQSRETLSDAEYEVLVDIALGLTDNTIAERRYLSRRGVQNRLHSLYAKLGTQLIANDNSDAGDIINARSRAVSIAMQRGLVNAFELKEQEKQLTDWLRTKR